MSVCEYCTYIQHAVVSAIVQKERTFGQEERTEIAGGFLTSDPGFHLSPGLMYVYWCFKQSLDFYALHSGCSDCLEALSK